MDLSAVNSILPTFIYFVGVIAGLWIAKGIVLRLSANYLLADNEIRSIRRPIQLIFWLAFGGLIAAPIVDLLTALYDVILLAFRSLRSELGIPQVPYIELLNLILLVVIYSVVIWIGRKLYNAFEQQNRLPVQLSALEIGAFWFVVASLLYRLAKSILLNLLLLPTSEPEFVFTLSPSGFFLFALVGIAILVGVIAILWFSLGSDELQDDN